MTTNQQTYNMQDTFWTPDLVAEFFNRYPLSGNMLTIQMEQFKSSKLPKKEWEIVAFTRFDEILALNPHDKLFHSAGRIASLDWALNPENNCTIHSVSRLSDGEVFSVGDKIGWIAHNKTITGFIVVGDNLQITHQDGRLCAVKGAGILNGLNKLPAAILVTADGKEITDPQVKVWVVYNDFAIYDHYVDTIRDHALKFGDNPIFSTREAAEDYVTENRPVLSLKDVKEVIKSRSLRDEIMEQLTTLVKQKLNS